ncbi:hypothetical protein [Halorubrum amylolyticum]|uniref:hypothetical protein n=1 Tax=Halorubrum amylolyticum TaxID=2508724 RepID=UPI0010087148|nr:hypothetical protein [Halorubrum amylolyticum]
MGLFTELGRRVEEFKQTAKSEVESAETFRCPACGEEFDGPRERCPECGEEMAGATGTTE